MNGRVNGTMEESPELSHVVSPENSHMDETNKEDDPSLKLIHSNTETNNDADSASEPTENSNNIAEVAISNGIVDHKPDKLRDDTTHMLQQESINNAAEIHCDTSCNELSSDSIYSPKESQNEQAVLDESDPLEDCNVNYKNEEINDSNLEISDESESSNDDECSEVPAEQKVKETETFKVDSDIDDSSQETQNPNKSAPLKEWPDGQNPNSKDCSSPEVQEIVDSCVIPDKEEPKPIKENKPPLRRSSRAIKRKRYDGQDMENGDDDSDIEEVIMPDFKRNDSRRKSKSIVINNTKTLVEMASKPIRSGPQKKDNTVVILDTHRESSNRGPMMRKNPMALNNTPLSAQNLYQSILARGTTVTPVSSKNATQQTHTQSTVTQSTVTQSNVQPAQPAILPSLTDDMFVVEAPSFIVPYVYEKPSVKPFREFVDELGKELAAEKAKEEEQEKEKKLAEKTKAGEEASDAEVKETKETVEEGEDENVKAEENAKVDEEKKKEKDVRKERRRRKRDEDDDASWDGSLESDDDDNCSDEEVAIVIKDKADSIDDIKDVTDLTVDKIITGKSDNYFDMTLGKFFMDIGLNLVQGFVQNDLLKQQNRKLYREKKGGHSTKSTETSITLLMKNLDISKEHNAPYKFKQLKCEFCTFKCESLLVMSHHLETPHMKNNVYKCNFCEYDSKSPHDILYHMESKHNTRGRLERAPAYHQCANCPFEDNGKGKLARHQIACAKKFKPDFNLSPPIEWEPPAKIPKMARARNQMLGSYQNTFNKGQNVNNNFGRPVMNNFGSSSMYRPRGRSPMGVPTRPTPIQGIPIIRSGIMGRHSNPVQMASNFAGNNEKNMPKSMYQPSISITPLPRQPQPVQPPPPSQQNKSTCVICEICDGYIKDLEQLRNHMQWIHKVKIHPKMIYNRPPLNCQKCQFRFFTDQGLERHLLGSHGLVTSSMQEAANKGKDAGRCPVCGRVYQWKLLNHVTRDHKLPLKPAHLSYKCTVCTATFGMYKQFENHVYSKHSVVAKRVMDKGQSAAAPVKSGQSLLKPLKINDEITIIPQPVKSTTDK
ncbi:titin homolog [Maniola hyperantus]|uniref:titin homolog n=1 Tax=Aphantopus hyperantus TaxID=2795564 RepID=UPI001569EB7E|nr:uncharacterized protein LOC117995666 [Maniola hyperantus]